MKTSITSKRTVFSRLGVLTLATLAAWPATTSLATDYFWSGAAGTYNNPAAWGGTVPGVADKAINDNGAGNAVQINIGDPDWIVNGILAGRSTGNGAFVQNGQTLNLSGATGRGAVRLGVTAGRSGAYTINGGTLNYNGDFNVGELGTATLNVNGGLISGGGNLAINIGSSSDAVTGTMDDGTNKGGHTWFERGVYTPDANRGLPLANSTVVSVSQADHSYTMPPSYAANNAVFLYNQLPAATITLNVPTAATALSFMGSSGGGAATINYTIHHSGGADQTGTMVVPDWYPPAEATVAVNVGGRVQANGFNYQNVDNEFPKLVSLDIALLDTVNPVTSIDLTYVSGGRAALLAVSKSTGADFTPVGISGYNMDIVMGAAEPIYVANTVTNVFNQTAGTISITGEMFVGNVGAGIYNLSGGTNTVANWIGVGRSGGNGVINMTGGVINKTGGGNLIFGTPYQNLPGHDVSGVLNHSGGTINVQSGEVWFPEGSSAFGTVSGTYNLSGTAVMNANNWFAIGRNGASGTLNMTGGTINKSAADGWRAMIIADGGGAVGQVTQSAGTINSSTEFWIGQNGGSATYNLSGTGALNVTNWFAIGRAGNGANGTLTITGGSLNQAVNGVFIVGDNSQGVLNQSAGTVSVRELWVGQGGGGNGTYDLSGTASLAVSGYVVIGRDGFGQFNMSGGTFTKTTGDGVFIIASGGSGSLNQSGGSVVSTLSDTWVAENGNATWSLSGSASATLSKLVLGLNSAGSGTLNLDGGTVTANEIAGGAGFSTLNLNGGTLVAAANNANFLHGVTAATLGASGVTVNSAGFNVTIAQAFQDNGGALTKNGAGTLTLSAPNTFVGATTINAGGFGVLVTTDNGQLSLGSAGFAGAAQTLDLDLSTFGSPGAAPLAVVGALNVNSPVTVNILASGALQIGVYPVITCGSRTGAGTFVLGSLPLNTVATLVDSGTTVSLNVTSVNAPRWEGLAGGNWDIGLTTNWINGGSGLPTFFSEGSAVVFNDEALGTTSVNLVTTVHPTTVTINNTNLPYTLYGAGKISGNIGLAKQGPGTVTIANNNDFTGPTVISAGVVSVTNLANAGSPSPIGSGNLVLSGGTLSYAGSAASVNRGYTVQAGAGTIDAQSNLGLSGPTAFGAGASTFKTGPAQLTYSGAGVKEHANYRVVNGTVVLDGTGGAQTNHNQGEMWVGNSPDTAAALVLTNTILNVDSWLAVGRGNGSVGNSSSLALYDSKLRTGSFSMGWDAGLPGNLAFPSLTMSGNSTITNNGDANIGESTGSTATLLLKDNSAFYSGGRIHLGWHSGGVGNMTVADSSTLTVNAWFSIGHEGGVSTLTLKDNSKTWVLNDMNITDVGTGTGQLDITNNATLSANNIFVGKGGGSSGIMNQSAGTTVIGRASGNEMQVGFHGQGTYNMSGGTLTLSNHWFVIGRWADGPGEFNLNGGTVVHNTTGKRVQVGEDGVGVFNLNSGSLSSIANELAIGLNASGNGTFNLNGGLLQVRRVIGINGASTFNFNGGTLLAGPNAQADFMRSLTTANVLALGANIDTSSNSISIAQSLLDGGGNGGLTKTGTGTLNLNGTNTYTGSTLVNAGTLGGNGTIAGPVNVAAGATLAPGTSIGALTVNNTVTLAANSTNVMEFSKTAGTNDVLNANAVTLGGTLVLKSLGGVLAVNDTFKLFNATTVSGSFSSVVSLIPGQSVTWDLSNLTVNGTVRVASVTAVPVVITSVPAGNTLQLNWPANQLGWRLEVQTNALATGLNTNWFTVPGSTQTTSVTVPVVPANPTVFYRLVYP